MNLNRCCLTFVTAWLLTNHNLPVLFYLKEIWMLSIRLKGFTEFCIFVFFLTAHGSHIKLNIIDNLDNIDNRISVKRKDTFSQFSHQCIRTNFSMDVRERGKIE